MRVADFAVASGNTVISTVGLGSCVAIVLHDAGARVGGMAHILLPAREMSRDVSNPAKFPETAVPLLLDGMKRLGSKGPVRARIIGGASMFSSLIPSGTNMGERNIAGARAALAAAGVPLHGEDVGGDYGRSVYFDVGDGRVTVRSLRAGDRVL